MNIKKVFAVIAALVVLSAPALAKKKPVTDEESVTVKATIEAIDHDRRLITFKDEDGVYEEVHAGPEIRRFAELKPGDKVSFKYTESLIYELYKPGESVPPPADGDVTVTRNSTVKPSAEVSQQATATVMVKAVDAKAGSLTVQNEDLETLSFRVKDKGKLKGVSPGDKLVITYKEAILISVQ